MLAKTDKLHLCLDELKIQPVGVGDGLVDLICPPESIGPFIDLCDLLHLKIEGFTWWCHVTDGHEPCGMGGPRSKYFDGWFSEIPMDDMVQLKDNASYRAYFDHDRSSEEDHRECCWPGVWLE